MIKRRTFVNDIPPETLIRIFEIGCLMSFLDRNDWPDSRRYTISPDYCSRRPKKFVRSPYLVCHNWRGVIKDTPGLWISSLTLWSNMAGTRNSRLHILQEQLENSKDGDIDVSLTDLLGHIGPFDEVQEYLKLVLSHARRLRTLNVYNPSGQYHRAVIPLLNHIATLPRLLELNMEGCDELEAFNVTQTFSTPSLLRLSTDHLSFPRQVVDLQVIPRTPFFYSIESWKRMIVPTMSVLRCLHLNLGTNNSLALNEYLFSNYELLGEVPRDKIVLPLLRTLYIIAPSFNTVMHSLMDIEAPQITHLSLHTGRDEMTAEELNTVQGFRLPNLRRLTVGGGVIDVNCLSLFSLLDAPSLESCRLDMRSHEALPRIMPNTIVFTHLHTFHLAYNHHGSPYKPFGELTVRFLSYFHMPNLRSLTAAASYVEIAHGKPSLHVMDFPNLISLAPLGIEFCRFVHAPNLRTLDLRGIYNGTRPANLEYDCGPVANQLVKVENIILNDESIHMLPLFRSVKSVTFAGRYSNMAHNEIALLVLFEPQLNLQKLPKAIRDRPLLPVGSSATKHKKAVVNKEPFAKSHPKFENLECLAFLGRHNRLQPPPPIFVQKLRTFVTHRSQTKMPIRRLAITNLTYQDKQWFLEHVEEFSSKVKLDDIDNSSLFKYLYEYDY